MISKLYCGAARVDYTPEESVFPFRTFTPGNSRPIVGVIDHTYVRAAVLSDGSKKVVLLSYDMPAPPDSDCPNSNPTPAIGKVAAALDIPEENVFTFGTHAHSIPGVGCLKPSATPEEIAFNDYYEARVYEATIQAVRLADAAMRPAKLGVGKGKSYINTNRDQIFFDRRLGDEIISYGANPEGPSSKDLFVMKICDENDAPIVLFANFAVHNVLMMCNTVFEDGVGISADIAGAVCTQLEKRYPGCVAMWSPAPCGDQDPVFMTMGYFPDPETGAHGAVQSGDSPALLRILSSRHLEDITAALNGIDSYETSCDLSCAVEWSVTPGRKPYVAEEKCGYKRFEYTDDGAEDCRIRMQLLRIGDTALIGTSGELYTTLGQAILEASPVKKSCVVEICATRSPGYILDDARLNRGGFKAPMSKIAPGYVKDSLMKTTKTLFDNAK